MSSILPSLPSTYRSEATHLNLERAMQDRDERQKRAVKAGRMTFEHFYHKPYAAAK